MNTAQAEQQGMGQMQMPRYQCHKKVWALKIAAIEPLPAALILPGGFYLITPADERYAPFTVAAAFVDKKLGHETLVVPLDAAKF